MPELPEAETVAQQLRQQLRGSKIVESWVGREDMVREGLSSLPWYQGAVVVNATRLGKSVLVHAQKHSETRFLLFELGMTGLLFFEVPDPTYRKHIHVALTFSGPVASLHYWNPRRFGRVYLLDQAGVERFEARRFGHDPLQVTWPQFRELIKSRRGRL